MQVEGLLARCHFPPAGTQVDCGVSGGADSMALMMLALAAGCEVTAWHVDHGSRPGSGAEADLVAAAAKRAGARFRGVRVVVEPGPNFEARARTARYGVLPPGVLTGHTADDQAETVLLNLMRGAALDGLSGMRPDHRPLLRVRRWETVALCAELELAIVEDPSNADPSFRRNRVRHELLPLLDEIAQRDVAGVLARQADLVRDAVDHLDQLASDLDPTDAKALRESPPALARLAVRRWVAVTTGLSHPVDAAAVERALAVARCEARGADVTGGWVVRRTDSRLRLEHR